MDNIISLMLLLSIVDVIFQSKQGNHVVDALAKWGLGIDIIHVG